MPFYSIFINKFLGIKPKFSHLSEVLAIISHLTREIYFRKFSSLEIFPLNRNSHLSDSHLTGVYCSYLISPKERFLVKFNEVVSNDAYKIELNHFMRNLFLENRPVTDLVAADYSYINDDLENYFMSRN